MRDNNRRIQNLLGQIFSSYVRVCWVSKHTDPIQVYAEKHLQSASLIVALSPPAFHTSSWGQREKVNICSSMFSASWGELLERRRGKRRAQRRGERPHVMSPQQLDRWSPHTCCHSQLPACIRAQLEHRWLCGIYSCALRTLRENDRKIKERCVWSLHSCELWIFPWKFIRPNHIYIYAFCFNPKQ